MNNLHTLTALTGRDSGANRTIVFKGFEARRRTVIVAAIGALPALFVTVILWGLIGQIAILALPAVEGLAFWLIETRSRNGLQRRTYESLLDKKRSDAGQFYMCGRVIDPDLNELGTVMAGTVPVVKPVTPVQVAAQPTSPPAESRRTRRSRREPVTPAPTELAVAATLPGTQLAMAGPVHPVPAAAPPARLVSFDAGDMFGMPAKKRAR